MLIWEEFLKAQESLLGRETTDRWLRTLKVVHFDACNLYLEAQDSFQVSWFEEHVRANIRSTLVNNNHRPIKVHLTCPDIKKKEKKEPHQEPPKPALSFTTSPLDPQATFENFVVAESHQIPCQFLRELTEQPGMLGSLNPIYLYGHSGVGKTHLLMALTHRFQKLGLNPFFIHAEEFTDHVVSAIRSGNMQDFRRTYRNAGVLLIDDIHLLAKRNATQEELFHTFNALHVEKKQIILSSNAAPQALKEIEARLVSRFEWGITLQLPQPSPLDREKILIAKSQALQFPLNEEVIAFLVSTFARSTASLLQALEALVLRSHLQKTTVLHLETAQTMLADLIEKEKQASLTPAKIIKTVAHFYGIPSDDILGKSQSHECALPRQISMYLCRKQLELPYLAIGSLFSRDHSTVMSSVKQIQKKIDEQERETCAALADLTRALHSS